MAIYHLILSACLAEPSGSCAPILLPAGDHADPAACTAAAARITQSWLADHPGLTAGAATCVANGDVEALPVTEIAPGIWFRQGETAQIAPENGGRIANLSFVVGDTVAVIDAGASRAEGQALYAAIRRVTDRPISHLILTHMHPDHSLGVAVFAEAGARVVGHPHLPDALAARAETYLSNFDRIIGPAAMIGTAVTAPEAVAPGGEIIDLGRTRLVLTPVRTAHTDNDLMVHDSATDTLFTGDLVFRDLAPVVDGSLNGWLAWLDLPPQPEPALIVPGHGPVAADWASATADQQQLLSALRDATRDQIAQGRAMSDAVPAIVDLLQPLADEWIDFSPTMARDATAAFKELEWE